MQLVLITLLRITADTAKILECSMHNIRTAEKPNRRAQAQKRVKRTCLVTTAGSAVVAADAVTVIGALTTHRMASSCMN